ncbi:MAG: A/G-specific adenine glycosylase [Halodesulfurarchaeum sp.]
MTDVGTVPEDPGDVRSALLDWYERGHREFPWRESEDPYEILVSEVMSQQTQLDRIVDPWKEFLDRWPTVESLARADRSSVVSFWSNASLGYNNRATYLHEAATLVLEEFDGEIPSSPERLQELPGVGPYTANAVASFAFNTGDAVVDTNVERVLYRAFDLGDDSDRFEAVARDLMPEGQSRVWNNAIMELGGVACQKTPRCDAESCPWREWCHAYRTGDFTAPDVPEQPEFDGSRRQFRGRIVSRLAERGSMPVDDLGHRISVEYSADGRYDREWLCGLLADLAGDGLVEVTEDDGTTVVTLRE